jgi:hypothetical protein
MSTELTEIKSELTELRTLIATEKSKRLDDSLFSKDLAPHYMNLAGKLAQSAMVPKAYQGKPQDLFVAMAMGYQVGLSVEQAIQAIAVINGRPCLWGDDMLALCMAHPDFVDITETPMLKDDSVVGYKIVVKRRGMSDGEAQFTLDMAKRAGLLGKQGPWTQYPERMLQLRARAFALRNRFPDALKGIKSREEAEDYIEAEYEPIESKATRTETLKHHIAKTAQPSVDDVVYGSADQPDEATTLALDELLYNLSQTMKRKDFDLESLEKALSYYEVSAVEDLTIEQVKHFMVQLEKRADVTYD